MTTDEETLRIYGKAKDFCYTYLTDSMSDLEKLHVIYDYLAGEIDYDYSALNLYQLIALISGKNLSDAKSLITDALSYDCFGFSDEMKTVIASAKTSATTVKELQEALRYNYLSRLSAFSVEGVLDNGAAVCEGISYAYMLFARIEGIECYQVIGKSKGVNHAWNKVCLDGKWYGIDATWGNIYVGASGGSESIFGSLSALTAISSTGTKYVNHSYFMIDDATLYEDHIEEVEENVSGITHLALGDAEYYKSVETATGHSLYVKNYEDVFAAMNYYLDAGSYYVQVLPDPDYENVYADLNTAFGSITGKGASVSSYSDRSLIVYYLVG